MKRYIIEHSNLGVYCGHIGGRPKFRREITRTDNDVSVFSNLAKAKAELLKLAAGAFILRRFADGSWTPIKRTSK